MAEKPEPKVKVKALVPVSIAGKTYGAEASFTASATAVEQALAVGLVEEAKK